MKILRKMFKKNKEKKDPRACPWCSEKQLSILAWGKGFLITPQETVRIEKMGRALELLKDNESEARIICMNPGCPHYAITSNNRETSALIQNASSSQATRGRMADIPADIQRSKQ